VARQFAGRHQDRVEADIAETVAAVGGEPGFRRRGDALLLSWRDRPRGVVELRARLDLDEDQ
jgi:hypothetical protein